MDFNFCRIVGVLIFFAVGTDAAVKKSPYPVDEIKKNVEAIVQASMERLNVKSVMFNMSIDGKEIVNKAYGISMTDIKATTDMNFRMAGTNTPFLTVLLLQLVDKGIVRLDDKLSKWYPDLPHADLITLRMIANSTTGYADFIITPSYVAATKADPFRNWTGDELVSIGVSEPMSFPPGQGWNYAHTNFVLLGQVLQKITGTPLNELLTQYILKPLNLKNTKYPSTSNIAEPVWHAYSSERGVYEDVTFWNPTQVINSGIMLSKLSDIGAWATAFGTGSLLSPQSYQELIGPSTTVFPHFTSDFYFAFGIIYDHGWLFFNPIFNGYMGMFSYLPSEKIGIVIYNTLSASNSSGVNYSELIFKDVINYLNTVRPIPVPQLKPQKNRVK